LSTSTIRLAVTLLKGPNVTQLKGVQEYSAIWRYAAQLNGDMQCQLKGPKGMASDAIVDAID